jgi:hypothetical protein
LADFVDFPQPLELHNVIGRAGYAKAVMRSEVLPWAYSISLYCATDPFFRFHILASINNQQQQASIEMGCEWLANSLSYTTVKVVKIHNWRLGLLHYVIQLMIFVYVVGYVVWFESGYQSNSSVAGYSASKVGWLAIHHHRFAWYTEPLC